jgi:hypothetical protein
MQTRILPVLVVAALSASCSAAIAPPPQPPAKTMIDTQLKALDKAKAVQQTVDQQKVDMDKKMDAAEGATSDPGKKND